MDIALSGAGQTTICQATGLALLRCTGQSVWRVQKPSFGPLNPPTRQPDQDRGEWGRWDVPAALTIYAGASPLGSYMETLAWAKPADLGTLGDVFPDDGEDVTPLITEVAQEWAEKNHMPPRSVPRGWRDDRRLYQLALPPDGWLVDLRMSDTVAALNSSADLMTTLRSFLPGQELTLGDLLGRDRELTSRVAEWIYGQVLDDGHLPHGIIYSSKWGVDLPCYAVWLRRMADGWAEASEPTRRIQPAAGKAIEADDPALRTAADKLNIVIH